MQPENHGPLPAFNVLVRLLEELENSSGTGSVEKRKILVDMFISHWREKVGNDIYPAFQLLLPHIDSEIRQLYNVKEKSLGKILVQALNLGPKSPEALSLLNYRAAPTKGSGVFADLAFHIIDERDTRATASETSIGDLTKLLGQMVGAKLPEQVTVMRELLQKLSAREMKWVLRIILRNLHINVSEKTFFRCWHPDAQLLFNVTNNLKEVCHELWDRQIRLEAKDQVVRPLSCFRPQRALFKKNVIGNFAEIVDQMPGFFYIEEKMDGERMQLHYVDHGAKIRYFSRRGKDYTSYYGNSVEDTKGTLSKHLKDIISSRVSTCVLDGEMVAWDDYNKEVCPFNKIKQAATGTNSKWRPMLLVFDILHLNGKDLAAYSLEQRKKALEAVIPKENRACGQGYLEILPYIVGKDASIISKEFNRAIAATSEGLIVKNPNLVYKVDGISNSWIKVKPEFMAGYQGENFDLIIVGGYYGSGRRSKLLSSYLCAVRDDEDYLTLCRVGSGFCSAIYEKIAHETEGKWFSDRQPTWLKMSLEVPDCFIHPQDSVVIEVKASQVIPSDRYYVGHSLRFPRFVSIREDKGPNECLTYEDFIEFQQHTSDKRARKPSKKAPLRKRIRIQNDELSSFTVVPKSSIFSGLTFWLAGDIYDPAYHSRRDLAQLVAENGGEITQDIQAPNVLIVSDCKVPRLVRIISEKLQDIVHPRWLFDSILNRRALPFEPRHYLFARTNSLEKSVKLVDKYGFPLYRRERPDDVGKLLENMPPSVGPFPRARLQQVLDELVQQRPFENNRCVIFNGTYIYFDEPSPRLERLVRFGNGNIRRLAEDPQITHVVVDNPAHQQLYGAKCVSSQWIRDRWNSVT